MLVKRQEKDNVIKAMYKSSTVCASIYNKNTQDLIMIFNNGGQYKYPLVENIDYTRFELAESHGSAFNTFIKKKYTGFEKMIPVDASTLQKIMDEINQLKNAEDKSLVDGLSKPMLESMNAFIGSFLTHGVINTALYNKVESTMKDYAKVAYKEAKAPAEVE